MGRGTYFPIQQSLCHNAKVVHAFESNTPFEKLPGTQINVPRLNLHSARGTTGAPLPAISCLGAFRTPVAAVRGWPRHAGIHAATKRASTNKTRRYPPRSASWI